MPIEAAPERQGNNPVLNDKEEIKHSEPRTKLCIGSQLKGEGVLHLTNQRVVWLAEGMGCAIDYPFVTVHALSRDAAAWPEPCLYCQLKTEDAGEDEEDGEGPEVPEFRFVPADANQLQRIFSVFSEMSALNPDPADEQVDSESEEEEEEDVQPGQQLGVFWSPEDNDAAMEDADSDEEPPIVKKGGYGGDIAMAM
eukprot:TRINITY_DN87631_c0_g1_i1.p1 TRINITY_DN87631_c0_g1~~TRINITY_DN87631_c0_g1_i1.p1  ORF type:complete len:196 (+),score=66.81 TRINITY_DN87631_c0_g1_i1:92-679(+)